MVPQHRIELWTQGFGLWCLSTESNCGHKDFQSFALPTELPRHNGDPDGTRTHDLRRDRAAF